MAPATATVKLLNRRREGTIAPPPRERPLPSPDAWGVAEGYLDAAGSWKEPPAATLAAVLDSLGADSPAPPDVSGVLVVHPGEDRRVHRPNEITLEDGTTLRVEAGDRLPLDLPYGYHSLADLETGRRRTLIKSPGSCVLPRGRTWGWAMQLYATRSRQSWGIGDLADLAEVAAWSAGELGAGLLLTNPLHAAVPVVPQDPSPYYPSSRRFRNPLYLRVEDVPGAATIGPRLAEVAAAGRALNDDRRIDRDQVFRLKMGILAEIWARVGDDPEFDRWCAAEGAPLETYATFCALSEAHGRPWASWPQGLRHPAAPDVASFRAEHRRRVDFHRWLQWLLDLQLARASAHVGLLADLAVGFDPGGADAWEWQDVLAPGMSVGAPPDQFNTRGQDWGLPPFDPWRLRTAGYGPFAQTLRAAFRHAGGVRLDHVMGLFRLFWVPHGASPGEGTYVRYPAGHLLDIVALESHRAGAYVVGEDLGTVEDEVRRELARRRILSYRVLWFEDAEPEGWPELALAAVTTHDLPTIAGVWSGTDLEAQRAIGLQPDEAATAALRHRIRRLSGLPDGAPCAEVVMGTYAHLARARSMLVAAELADALAVEERPNMPGTVSEWPNWSIALPAPVEEIEAHQASRRVAAALGHERQPSPTR